MEDIYIYYKIDENSKYGSWEDFLQRSHHYVYNGRYKSVTWTKRVRYSHRIKEMKKNKSLKKKEDRNMWKVDIRLPNFFPGK